MTWERVKDDLNNNVSLSACDDISEQNTQALTISLFHIHKIESSHIYDNYSHNYPNVMNDESVNS